MAQDSASSSGFEYQAFDEEQLNEFRSDEDFNYEEQSYSRFPLWEAFLKGLGNVLESIFGAAPGVDTMRIIFYVIAGLVLLWAIIKLFGIDITAGIKRKKTQKERLEHHIREENIHEIDFAREIAEARQAQRWRLLIRLQYLYSLKMLSDAGLLQVRAGKTNHDYMYEIGQADLKEVFGKLSYIFEYTWYGHFEANEPVRKAADAQAVRLQNLLDKT